MVGRRRVVAQRPDGGLGMRRLARRAGGADAACTIGDETFGCRQNLQAARRRSGCATAAAPSPRGRPPRRWTSKCGYPPGPPAARLRPAAALARPRPSPGLPVALGGSNTCAHGLAAAHSERSYTPMLTARRAAHGQRLGRRPRSTTAWLRPSGRPDVCTAACIGRYRADQRTVCDRRVPARTWASPRAPASSTAPSTMQAGSGCAR